MEGAAAKGDLAKDNRKAQSLLGMIVGGWHAFDFEEGEEIAGIAFWIDETIA